MDKYAGLWTCVQAHGEDHFQLTFDEIAEITGFPIDHAFLSCKKALTDYGYEVGKISMKLQTVQFRRLPAHRKKEN